METKIEKMRQLLTTRLPSAGVVRTGVEGAGLFRIDAGYRKRPELYAPQIILLAQGKKRIFLGDKTYEYDSCHYYVQALPLPVECEAVIEDGKPMLGMVLKIDPQVIGEILFEMNAGVPATGKVSDSLYSARLSDGIIDAAIRLLETLDSKNEAKVLGPMYFKEIIFKIINGEHGETLRELVMNNRGFYQISRAIGNIHEHYSHPIDIGELAKEAGMSSTAFYNTFKSVTSTSPLQYIKNIRLHKAKELIQQEGEKANAAAGRVGYESISQFSREYKRCFGVTPASDKMAATA